MSDIFAGINKIALSNRMRSYMVGPVLLPRTPIIIDLVPFPYKGDFSQAFSEGRQFPEALCRLCAVFPGVVFGYTNFLSLSLIITDYPEWTKFSFRDQQELSSLASSFATSASGGKHFVTHSFNLPKDEVINWFIWKQMNLAARLLAVAGTQNAPSDVVEDFIDDGPPAASSHGMTGTWWRGRACNKAVGPFETDGGPTWFWDIDTSIPAFTANREYVTGHVYPKLQM